MKRFFCTKCKRVVRVSKLPRNVVGEHAERPADRTGQCKRHGEKLRD